MWYASAVLRYGSLAIPYFFFPAGSTRDVPNGVVYLYSDSDVMLLSKHDKSRFLTI